ncbi:MAG: hypothetical protein Q8N91_03515, partial [Candidatus Omnitrophota bacterium]|nr:hypothetical protein [Candidatus Omnitrophota bacterium]
FDYPELRDEHGCPDSVTIETLRYTRTKDNSVLTKELLLGDDIKGQAAVVSTEDYELVEIENIDPLTDLTEIDWRKVYYYKNATGESGVVTEKKELPGALTVYRWEKKVRKDDGTYTTLLPDEYYTPDGSNMQKAPGGKIKYVLYERLKNVIRVHERWTLDNKKELDLDKHPELADKNIENMPGWRRYLKGLEVYTVTETGDVYSVPVSGPDAEEGLYYFGYVYIPKAGVSGDEDGYGEEEGALIQLKKSQKIDSKGQPALLDPYYRRHPQVIHKNEIMEKELYYHFYHNSRHLVLVKTLGEDGKFSLGEIQEEDKEVRILYEYAGNLAISGKENENVSLSVDGKPSKPLSITELAMPIYAEGSLEALIAPKDAARFVQPEYNYIYRTDELTGIEQAYLIPPTPATPARNFVKDEKPVAGFEIKKGRMIDRRFNQESIILDNPGKITINRRSHSIESGDFIGGPTIARVKRVDNEFRTTYENNEYVDIWQKGWTFRASVSKPGEVIRAFNRETGCDYYYEQSKLKKIVFDRPYIPPIPQIDAKFVIAHNGIVETIFDGSKADGGRVIGQVYSDGTREDIKYRPERLDEASAAYQEWAYFKDKKGNGYSWQHNTKDLNKEVAKIKTVSGATGKYKYDNGKFVLNIDDNLLGRSYDTKGRMRVKEDDNLLGRSYYTPSFPKKFREFADEHGGIVFANYDGTNKGDALIWTRQVYADGTVEEMDHAAGIKTVFDSHGMKIVRYEYDSAGRLKKKIDYAKRRITVYQDSGYIETGNLITMAGIETDLDGKSNPKSFKGIQVKGGAFYAEVSGQPGIYFRTPRGRTQADAKVKASPKADNSGMDEQALEEYEYDPKTGNLSKKIDHVNRRMTVYDHYEEKGSLTTMTGIETDLDGKSNPKPFRGIQVKDGPFYSETDEPDVYFKTLPEDKQAKAEDKQAKAMVRARPKPDNSGMDEKAPALEEYEYNSDGSLKNVRRECYFGKDKDGKDAALVILRYRESLTGISGIASNLVYNRRTITRKVTVLVPLTADKQLDKSRPFKVFNGYITDLNKAKNMNPDGVLSLPPDPEPKPSEAAKPGQGSTAIVAAAWPVLDSLGTLFPASDVKTIEDAIFAHFREAVKSDYLRFMKKKGVTIYASKVLEKEIFSEMYNLVQSYKKEKNSPDFQLRTYINWARFNLERLKAFEEVSYQEFFGDKRDVENYHDNIRYVRRSLLVMLSANDVKEVYKLFNHPCTETPLVSWNGREPKNNVFPFDLTNAALAFATKDKETGRMVVDMTSRELQVLIWSRKNGKTPVRITCVDVNGGKASFVAIVRGNSMLDALDDEQKARLTHQIDFSPGTKDSRYNIEKSKSPVFNPEKVTRFTIEDTLDLSAFDIKVVMEDLSPSFSSAQTEQTSVFNYLGENAFSKSMNGLEIAKKMDREEIEEKDTGVRHVYGKFCYDLTQNFVPIDVSNDKVYIFFQLPVQFRKEGVKVILSFITKGGGQFSEEFLTKDSSGIVSETFKPKRTTDFDPTKVIALEARFELAARPVLPQGKGILPRVISTAVIAGSLIPLIALAFIISVFLFLRKNWMDDSKIKKAIERRRKEPQSPSPVPLPAGAPPAPLPAVPAPDPDEALLKALGDAGENINKWVNDIGVDIRYEGSQQEDKGIFFPRIRKSEPWEFFDQNSAPRYKRIILKNILLIAGGALLYFGAPVFGGAPLFGHFSFAAYPGLLHLYPYIILMMASGFLNWFKLGRSIMIGGGLLFLQQLFSDSLDQTSLVLSAALIGFDIARLYWKYYKDVVGLNSRPAIYIQSQIAQLEDLRTRLIKIKENETIIDKIGDRTRPRRSRDVDEWDKQKYVGGGITTTPHFSQILDESIEEIDVLIAKGKESLRSLGREDVEAPELDDTARREIQQSVLRYNHAKSAGMTLVVAVGLMAIFCAIRYFYASNLTVALIAAGAVTLIAFAIFVRIVTERAKALTLIYPALDMKNIYRDFQRLIYSSSTRKNLKAIDVRRFLVQARAAVSMAKEAGIAITPGNIQEKLDSSRDAMINVRDSATVRDFMDSFHLTEIEKLPKRISMIFRIGIVIFALTTLSYIVIIIGIVGVRELFSLIGTGELTVYGAMFEHPFGIVEFGRGIVDFAYHTDSVGKFLSGILSILNPFTTNVYITDVQSWIPTMLLQSFFGISMLASLMLFAAKFVFYDLGRYSRVYLSQTEPSAKPYKLRAILSAAALVALSIFGQDAVSMYNISPWLFLFAKISLMALSLHSTWKWAVIRTARHRFKAISEDDKLYDGRQDNDLTMIEDVRRKKTNTESEKLISFDKFVQTLLYKFEPEDLSLVHKV